MKRKLNIYIFFVLCFSITGINAQGRERINLDKQWKFSFGHTSQPKNDYNYSTAQLFSKTAENFGTCIIPAFDDTDWRSIDIPHDWAVELPFEYAQNGDVQSHGYKPVGGIYPKNSIGWYRKKFNLNTNIDTTRRVVLTFDGVFRNSQVWVNNFYCGTHFSGYTSFSYDITDFVHYGKENQIVVRVDASKYEGWFYEGAGIYRHVWLNLFDNTHFTENGIFVYADLNNDFSEATLTVHSEVENTCDVLKDASVTTIIYDPNGKKLTQTENEPVRLNPNGRGLIEEKIIINNPELWDIVNPKRYKAVSEIFIDGKLVDKIETRFGVRDIRINSDNGLLLNGRKIKIKGVCCHQDHAGVGSALPDYLHYYRIGLLKEMGVNAYRTSHNPNAPELLEACDSLGMLVLNETRLLNSSTEYSSQMKSLVLRDRNHPSIFMWSIGNEENVFQTKIEGKRIAQSFIRLIRSLDTSRTITYGANVGNVTSGVSEVIPVRGFNYNLWGFDGYHEARPNQPILGTEVGSTVTTRGVYMKDTVKCYLTDFDENYPPWASTAEEWWRMAAERDWLMGGFVWTGFDYRGEPTPYSWPNINSHFGIMDMCGFPKNIYYYYQSWWTDNDVLHIAPHWNWKGKEGEKIKVWVNSNAQFVELFLNKKSLGKKEMPQNGHLNWDVIYQPGELKAIAYKNGRKFEQTIETTDAPYQIVLSPSKINIAANSRDAVIVNVTVTDRKGREVPNANQMIHFSLTNDAKIIGVGNGDPSCHEPDKCIDRNWQRSLFNGKCQLIIQAGEINSILSLTATSDKIKSSTISLIQM